MRSSLGWESRRNIGLRRTQRRHERVPVVETRRGVDAGGVVSGVCEAGGPPWHTQCHPPCDSPYREERSGLSPGVLGPRTSVRFARNLWRHRVAADAIPGRHPKWTAHPPVGNTTGFRAERGLRAQSSESSTRTHLLRVEVHTWTPTREDAKGMFTVQRPIARRRGSEWRTHGGVATITPVTGGCSIA